MAISPATSGAPAAALPPRLDAAQQRQADRMAARDREVRAHEQAHLAAGAGLVRGGPSFTYERGPDGRLYATGGEVSIDTSAGSTAEETLLRARQIRAAALAPARPSAQDHAVAAQAGQMEMEARQELARQALDLYRENGSGDIPRGRLDLYA